MVHERTCPAAIYRVRGGPSASAVTVTTPRLAPSHQKPPRSITGLIRVLISLPGAGHVKEFRP